MEANEILKLIGFELPEGTELKDLQIDSVRDYIGEKFVTVNDLKNRKDLIDPFVKGEIGKRLGSIQTKLISSGKELGLEVSHTDFEGKQLEDMIPTLFSGISEKLKATKQPDDKLSKEIERVTTEYNQLKEAYTGKESEFNELKTGFETEKTNWIKGREEGEAWKTVAYLPTVKPFERIGFETTIKNTYDSAVSESGEVYPVYREGEKKGSRVKNPSKLTEDLKWSDLLKLEAQKAELLADAHSGKVVKPQGGQTRQPQEQPKPQAGARRVHPSFAG